MTANRCVGGLTVVLLSIGLAACGGGSKELSKDKLASKANAICQKAERDVKKVPQPTSIQDAGDAAKYFDKVAPIADQETSDLQDLSPADDVKDDWNAFISQQQSARKLLDTIRDKADKKDVSGLADVSKITAIGDKVSASAKKVGAGSCS